MNSGEIVFSFLFGLAGVMAISGIIGYKLVKKVPIGEDGAYHMNSRTYLSGLGNYKDGNWKGRFGMLKQGFKTWKRVSFRLFREKTIAVFPFHMLSLVFLGLFAGSLNAAIFSILPYVVGVFSLIFSERFLIKLFTKSAPRVFYFGISQENSLKNALQLSIKSGISSSFFLCSISSLQFVILIILFNRHYLSISYSSATYSQMYSYLTIYSGACAIHSFVSLAISKIFTQSNTLSKYPQSADTSPLIDIFFTYSLSTSSSLYITSLSPQLIQRASSMYFPLSIQLFSLLISFILSICFYLFSSRITKKKQFALFLKRFIILYSVLMSVVLYFITGRLLPDRFEFFFDRKVVEVSRISTFLCMNIGMFLPGISGILGEFLLRKRVEEVGKSYHTGEATGIIYGLAFGYFSCICNAFALAFTFATSFYLAGIYGVCITSTGCVMILPLYAVLAVVEQIGNHVYCMAKVVGLEGKNIEKVKNFTEIARVYYKHGEIVQGFVTGIACFLVLFKIFKREHLNLLTPLTFVGSFSGGMLAFAVCAVILSGIGKKSMLGEEEIEKVSRNFLENYEKSSQISIANAKKTGFLLSLFVFLSGIVSGLIFGLEFSGGLILGTAVVGIYISTSGVNSSNIWNITGKYLKNQEFGLNYSKNTKNSINTTKILSEVLKDSVSPITTNLSKALPSILLLYSAIYSNNPQ